MRLTKKGFREYLERAVEERRQFRSGHNRCPIARYLSDETGLPVGVALYRYVVARKGVVSCAVAEPCPVCSDEDLTRPTPAWADRFVVAFDNRVRQSSGSRLSAKATLALFEQVA